jgi:two-component system sensor histidine kinase PilS (NtrC family)
MIGIRLVAITSLVLPYLLIQLSTDLLTPGFDHLYVFAALIYGASLLFILAMRLGLPPLAQAALQFAGDLLLVTYLVYYFGSSSAFSVLYLAVIMTAAAIVGPGGALTVSSIASVLYVTVSIAAFAGWLPAPTGSERLSLSMLLYKLGVHLVGFYGVAILASRLVAGFSRLETELEEEREHLANLRVRHQDILQSVPSGLLTTDPGGIVTSLNRAGEEILGVSAPAVEGLSIEATGMFTRQSWDRFHADPELGTQRNELTILRDDETRYVGFSVTRLTSAEGSPTGWVIVFRDLTEWRQLEERLRLKDRMAAVGELAAGIAHELGNPLAAISGSVQMLSREAPEGSPQRKLLDIMSKESQRLDRTIKGFLQFARPKERSIVEFDVCRLLEENVELLRNSKEVSEEHRLTLELTHPSIRMTADPDQISQLFWNLARNALRAMPEGGELAILGELAGDELHLVFRDTGVGMTDEERRKVFHPFRSGFTGGIGIGMSIVYRIVEEHGGHLDVESRPNLGTTITVRLPARLESMIPLRAGA